MGFLKRNVNSEEPEQESDLEEQYKNLFPKIGRDFVAREDFESLLTLIASIIDPLGLSPFNYDDNNAKALARRYADLVDKGKDGGESKRDLIKEEKDAS